MLGAWDRKYVEIHNDQFAGESMYQIMGFNRFNRELRAGRCISATVTGSIGSDSLESA
jgi:hypothetical protein